MVPPPVTLSVHEPGPGANRSRSCLSCDTADERSAGDGRACLRERTAQLGAARFGDGPTREALTPARFESVIVAASAVHHVTLHACPPPAITTEKLVPVSAPVGSVPGAASVEPILNVQVAVKDGPSSVKTPVSAAAAGNSRTPA